MKVAIDGPAGGGKSTIARMIAEDFGFLYINSGNLYRAIAYLALQENICWQDSKAMIALVQRHHFDYLPDGSVDVDGKILDGELRSPQVDAIVSQVSAIPEIRAQVNLIIRSISEGKDVVSEGRDITTVVFPDAEIKLYLDASPEVRATRRFKERLAQQTSDTPASIEEIRKNIEMRDKLDAQKTVGALKIAQDAIYLDTSDLTIQQVYEKVYKILRARIAHGRK
ncbi:MAG TPA: (d)CMP kinase [Spirochaetaceae bacterium]|jgi:cytidylate kinase|nr:(d)CMP kinase [Spirochaetaceae bacterium]